MQQNTWRVLVCLDVIPVVVNSCVCVSIIKTSYAMKNILSNIHDSHSVSFLWGQVMGYILSLSADTKNQSIKSNGICSRSNWNISRTYFNI